jgi:hypothetical protein
LVTFSLLRSTTARSRLLKVPQANGMFLFFSLVYPNSLPPHV